MISGRTMNFLLKRGFMKTADYLLKNYFLREGIDISKGIKKTIIAQKARLDEIIKMTAHVKKPLM